MWLISRRRCNLSIISIIFVIATCSAATGLPRKQDPPFWSAFIPERAGPTTFTEADNYITGHNVYFHGNRFFSLVDIPTQISPNKQLNTRFSHNTPLTPLPLNNVSTFLSSSIQARWVEGTTLWVDYPYPSQPEHMGYWTEILAPVFSYLSQDDSALDVSTVLIPNLRRADTAAFPWAMEMLRVAISPAIKENREPRVLFWDDLEAMNLTTWVCFEHAVHMYSRHDHPSYNKELGFATPGFAAAFRSAALAASNLSAPLIQGSAPPPPPPRTITYLMSADGDAIVNSKEVLAVLHTAAARAGFSVRPYSPTALVPLASFVAVMARTGVLVGRHSHMLANAVFLPPGAAVVELLPCNWEVGRMSEAYLNLTRTTGTVSHVAWRAPSTEFMSYTAPEDLRYKTWTPEECSSETCLAAHARAGLVVDPQALEKLVKDALDAVIGRVAPETVRKRHSWPRWVELTGRTGLWWDTD